VSQTLVLAGWLLAIGGLVAAVMARHRLACLAEAVARTCHELRGPLTAVGLGLELALGGEQANARLRAIELELGRATLALEDLSAVWQRSVGQGSSLTAPGAEQVDVAQLLTDSVEAWQGAAAARGVELRLTHLGSRPLVLGDRLRLAQAVGNLIANAIEHGGGPVVVSSQSDEAWVRIEVADLGIGLPAPVAELLSRPVLWRTPRLGSARRRGGRAGSVRGHGLAVARGVALTHGGRLAAAPSEVGARLVVELPRLR
jgi:signal transduction histidine kinase